MKKIPSINSGSMADIAFLLLIFFLVATTIEQDQGLLRKLPPKITDTTPTKQVKRNVLSVWVNSNNLISVNDKLTSIEELRAVCKGFIDNKGIRANWSESPDKAIISLKASTGTSYDTYIQVQNEMAAAYHELRDGFSRAHYGRNFYDLESEEQVKAVKKKYPMKISEAEPDISAEVKSMAKP